DDRRADGDGGVGIAGPADIADGACVDVALDRLEFANDFEGADLRGPADRTRREGRLEHVHRTEAFAQLAFDLADDVHDMRVTLDGEALGQAHAARRTHAADVVAA